MNLLSGLLHRSLTVHLGRTLIKLIDTGGEMTCLAECRQLTIREHRQEDEDDKLQAGHLAIERQVFFIGIETIVKLLISIPYIY
jgi:hypothetical protein